MLDGYSWEESGQRELESELRTTWALDLAREFMIVFELLVNGRKLGVSGLEGDGVMSANLCLLAKEGQTELKLDLGAFYRSPDGVKHFPKWGEWNVAVGDRIEIVIKDSDKCDVPTQVTVETPDEVRRMKMAYLKRLQKELRSKSEEP